MDFTPKQEDVMASTLDACLRIGLYQGLGLGLGAFRSRRCDEIVEASGRTCPLDLVSPGVHLDTFLVRLVDNLEELGYVPRVERGLLCAVRRTSAGQLEPWTWGDWCDHLASRI